MPAATSRVATGFVTRIATGVALALGASAALFACATPNEAPPAPRDAGADERAAADAARASCAEGGPREGYPAPPFGFALGATLPDLAFEGERGALTLGAHYEPCAPRSRLLVLRVGAGFCGTCRWSTAHTGELLASLGEARERVRLVDVVVTDDDNAPASLAFLEAYRARIHGAPDGEAVVVRDPGFRLGPLSDAHGALPLVVLVDTRTMRVDNALANPSPSFLEDRIRESLASLDGASAPEPAAFGLHDERFTRDEWEMLGEMALTAASSAPPADPTNRVADDPRAAALGAALFADTGLSPSGKIACATCHVEARGWGDGLARSVGVATVDRNAPPVLFAAHARWQFWDGRADSLWMQALLPMENAREMGSSRLFVAHAVARRHREAYEAVFGPLPARLGDAARFPPSGKPGDAAYDAMAQADRDAATRVFVDAGKAIAAFERTLRAAPSRFDAYAMGATGALTAAERDGLRDFFRAGCAQCHYGPRLTDDAFHALRFPTGRVDGAADLGREGAVRALLADPFNARGAYSDADATHATAATRALASLEAFLAAGASSPEHDGAHGGFGMRGAFKTPTLRGVAATGPFGHGGAFATLEEVAGLYGDDSVPAGDPRATGAREPWVPRFAGDHQATIVTFLRTLTAEPAR